MLTVVDAVVCQTKSSPKGLRHSLPHFLKCCLADSFQLNLCLEIALGRKQLLCPRLHTFPGISKSVSHLVVSDSLGPHGLQPARLLCPWNSPGKNTGVGSHSLLQGIFLIQGSNLGLLPCRQILYHLSHQGSPASNDWSVQGYKDLINLPQFRISLQDHSSFRALLWDQLRLCCFPVQLHPLFQLAALTAFLMFPLRELSIHISISESISSETGR